jgi:hypothetical protein
MTMWDLNPGEFRDTWTGKTMSYAAKEWGEIVKLTGLMMFLQGSGVECLICYVSTARSARPEQVPNDGYVVCSVPGIEANWYAVCG